MGRKSRKPNRAHGSIDRLPQELRETVDAMLATDSTYQNIVDVVISSGYQTSKSSVQRYAARCGAMVDDIRRGRQLMRVVMDEVDKHPSIDGAAAILNLTEQQLFSAVSSLSPESWEGMTAKDVVQQSTAFIRAATAKRKTDNELAADAEKLVTAQGGFLFDALRKYPKLYEQVMDVFRREAEDA